LIGPSMAARSARVCVPRRVKEAMNIRDPKGYDLPNQERALSWQGLVLLVRDATVRQAARIYCGLTKGRPENGRQIHK
jgi:hypothetical protein